MATLTQTQPAQNGASHPFTCNTCQIALRTSEVQRTHMQSDWHRYNLKRRVASLPPLTSEIFAEKVLANKASAAATAARASFEKRCEPCDKTYYSEGAFANHLGSQKHRLLAARWNARAGHETESLAESSTFELGEAVGENVSVTTGSTIGADDRALDEVVTVLQGAGLEDGSAASVASSVVGVPPSVVAAGHGEAVDEEGEYVHKADLQQCLFCNYISPALDSNVIHMGRQHGFFIPEQQYLVDLAGLINYLSETIQVLHQCLFCHKTLHTASGMQTHMRDRGHCMIAYETEDDQMEVGEFYDFRSTYSDSETDEEEEEEVAQGGVSLGAKRKTETTYQNEAGEDVQMGEGEDDDEGWESDSSLSSVPTDELTSVPMEHQAKPDLSRRNSHATTTTDKKHTSRPTNGAVRPNTNYNSNTAFHDDFELHLPSGRTAGHRSLRVYYRQNLNTYPSPEERARQQQQQQLLEEGRHNSDADDDDTETESTGRQRGERGRQQLVSRANGGLGMLGVSEARRREVRVAEKRDLKRQERAENRYRAGKEKRNNMQKHYRDPLLQ